MSPAKEPRCGRCGGSDLLEPGPMRTSAHPNSSFLLVETAGAQYHNHTVQGTVCLDCGAVELGMSAATLAGLRASLGRGTRKRKG